MRGLTVQPKQRSFWILVCREFSKGRKTTQRQPETKSSQLSLGEDASIFKLIKVLREWNIPMQLIMDHWYTMLVAACSLLWSQSLYLSHCITLNWHSQISGHYFHVFFFLLFEHSKGKVKSIYIHSNSMY